MFIVRPICIRVVESDPAAGVVLSDMGIPPEGVAPSDIGRVAVIDVSAGCEKPPVAGEPLMVMEDADVPTAEAFQTTIAQATAASTTREARISLRSSAKGWVAMYVRPR
jgi:hypothetical protein